MLSVENLIYRKEVKHPNNEFYDDYMSKWCLLVHHIILFKLLYKAKIVKESSSI